jgi:hypothetical protein
MIQEERYISQAHFSTDSGPFLVFLAALESCYSYPF